MEFILWTALIGLGLAAWAGLIYFLIFEPVRLVRAARFEDHGRERLGIDDREKAAASLERPAA